MDQFYGWGIVDSGGNRAVPMVMDIHIAVAFLKHCREVNPEIELRVVQLFYKEEGE